MALPDSIPLTKDPGCKNFYDLGTPSATFDETLHAAPKWRENDKSFSSHLPNMLVRRDIAGWGRGGGGGAQPTFLFEKSHRRSQFFKNFSTFFCNSIKHR